MKKQKMNINELRELAVSLGAERKRLYGTSRMALLLIIQDLKKNKNNEMGNAQ